MSLAFLSLINIWCSMNTKFSSLLWWFGNEHPLQLRQSWKSLVKHSTCDQRAVFHRDQTAVLAMEVPHFCAKSWIYCTHRNWYWYKTKCTCIYLSSMNQRCIFYYNIITYERLCNIHDNSTYFHKKNKAELISRWFYSSAQIESCRKNNGAT